MKEDQQRVCDLFGKVLFHKVHSFEIQSNSGLVINFAQDLKYKPTNQENAPWYFWFYTAIWQLELSDQILLTSNDTQAKIQSTMKKLKGKKLLEVEVPSDKYDVKLRFEDHLVFHLMAEDYRDCHISVKIQKLEIEA